MNIHILCPEGHPLSIPVCKLGSAVICPQCCTPFAAPSLLESARHARAEKGKARSSRDDDDDDDDDEADEKPQKKAKPKPAKNKDDDEKPQKKAKPKPKPAKNRDDDEEDEDEEDEKPQKKTKPKPRRAKDDEDEDDEDEEEDEDDEEHGEAEEQEEEEPIEWTPRKRQLFACNIGLNVMKVGLYMIDASLVIGAIAVDVGNLVSDWLSIAWFLYYWMVLPLVYLGQATLVGCMFISLRVPAKAEARGPLLAGLVFAALVFVVGIVLILTLFGLLTDDVLRQRNMLKLLVAVSTACFIVSLLSLMGFMSKLLTFMRLNLEASLPVTNGGFIVMSMVVMMVTMSLSQTLYEFADWTIYVVAGLVTIAAGYASYMIVLHVALIDKLRKTINVYIRDG